MTLPSCPPWWCACVEHPALRNASSLVGLLRGIVPPSPVPLLAREICHCFGRCCQVFVRESSIGEKYASLSSDVLYCDVSLAVGFSRYLLSAARYCNPWMLFGVFEARRRQQSKIHGGQASFHALITKLSYANNFTTFSLSGCAVLMTRTNEPRARALRCVIPSFCFCAGGARGEHRAPRRRTGGGRGASPVGQAR